LHPVPCAPAHSALGNRPHGPTHPLPTNGQMPPNASRKRLRAQKVMRSGNKGDIFNHVITTTLLGVADYGSCVVGTFTDSRTSGPQLGRAANAALNPGHQFATVLDNGWRFPASL
jgi:hypothetical protein